MRWYAACKRSTNVKPWDWLYYEYLHNFAKTQSFGGHINSASAWFGINRTFQVL